MGYTHYWVDRPKTLENYESLCADVDKIGGYCSRVGIALAGYDRGKYRKGAPLHYSRFIAFNGIGKDAHEPFSMPKDYDESNDSLSVFCKTARKPYDLAVCLVLLRMAEIVPGFTFESDGDPDSEPEWLTAKQAYEEIFG
ncbi:hypothetical protein [Ferrimicrobium acidiphilum]|uniref:hypothetical protein n=1 Tax=Ferrimicrobium acidiphilum TaxID=121039 RepID=UPI0023F47906|nr:hypothetical protein [Ferrimicrobium acidiphilum]